MTRIRKFVLSEFYDRLNTPVESVLNFTMFRERLEKDDFGGLVNKDAILSKIDALEADPNFNGQVINKALLVKYEVDIQRILTPFFSPFLQDNEIKAGMMPFFPYLFNGTNRFLNLVDQAGSPENIWSDMDQKDDRYRNACVFILERFYGVGLDISRVFHVKIKNKATGQNTYYRSLINADYMSIHLKDENDRLSKEDIALLLENIDDEELWREKIKPHSYQIRGFGIMTLLDITRDRTISNLKTDLLQADLLYREDLQKSVNKDLRSILQIPDLKLGFLAFNRDKEEFKAVGVGLWSSILMKGQIIIRLDDIFKPAFHKGKEEGKGHQPFLLNDQAKEMLLPHLVSNLAEQNVRSYAAIPLVHEDQLIGIMEISSKIEGSITLLKLGELNDITPLFVTAFKGYIDDYETQLKAIIQEKYTAIHPAVEWRFKQEAEEAFSMRSIGQKEVEKTILFEQIHPLYGQTDVKRSSIKRNEAIRKDISIQLNETEKIFKTAVQEQGLPVYKMLLQHIRSHKEMLEHNLGAGDETELLRFLSDRIYPTFSHLSSISKKVAKRIEDYEKMLDPNSGLVIDHRSEYESALALINKTIAIALEKGQQKAQEMFPHYFKKYKTDGIEHDIYIGAALTIAKEYDPVYLDNIRLWQMMVICEIENKIYNVQKDKDYTLDVCSLILVHHNPISIKFRMDEKQFDVEGAYNLRYEIIKKRIDKATIKGTDERITQPGKLAIIYTQDEERLAYLSYIQYLQSINYLTENVEEYALSDMQGVTGLRALRVSFVFDQKEEDSIPLSDDILVSLS